MLWKQINTTKLELCIYYSKLRSASSNLFEKRNLENCLQFNTMRFLLRKFNCRFMLKFSWVHFQVFLFFYFPCQKKVKKAWGQGWVEKITWTETFFRSIKFVKWKTTWNRGTLASYEKLPIKTTLKKYAIFFHVSL